MAGNEAVGQESVVPVDQQLRLERPGLEGWSKQVEEVFVPGCSWQQGGTVRLYAHAWWCLLQICIQCRVPSVLWSCLNSRFLL